MDARTEIFQSGKPGPSLPSRWSILGSFVCPRQPSPKEDLNMSGVVYDTFSSHAEQIRLNLHCALDRHFRDHEDNGKG